MIFMYKAIHYYRQMYSKVSTAIAYKYNSLILHMFCRHQDQHARKKEYKNLELQADVNILLILEKRANAAWDTSVWKSQK